MTIKDTIKKEWNIADPQDAQEYYDYVVDVEEKITNTLAHAFGFCGAWTVTEIVAKHYGHHFASKPAKFLMFGGLTGIGTLVKNQVTKACSVDKETVEIKVTCKINKKREKLGLPPLDFN